MAIPVGLDKLKMTVSARRAIDKSKELGLRITSAYRSPADDKRVGGTGRGYHTLGQALDVAGSKAKMDEYAKWAKNSGLFRSVLWQVAGHYDHVHVSWDASGATEKLPAGNNGNIGDKNNFVGAIQALLGGLTIDKIFGPKTKKAVEEFQKNRNLEVDGIVGPKTWKALTEGSGLFFYR